jgi:hypothetical protein
LVARSVRWNNEFNNGLEWTWKETAVVECEGLPRHFPRMTKDNNVNLLKVLVSWQKYESGVSSIQSRSVIQVVAMSNESALCLYNDDDDNNNNNTFYRLGPAPSH